LSIWKPSSARFTGFDPVTNEVESEGNSDSIAIWMLACGETIGWASLFYIYGALLVWIEADTGWHRASLAIGLTLALVVSGLTVGLAGRLVDRGLGAEMLTVGAALGGLALLGLSQVQTLLQWYVVWAIIGLAMSASFYDMCFAFLTRRLGRDARAAIIRVTLVAGLASTLAFPLGAVLAERFGWRGAVTSFGLLQLFVTVPLFFFAGRRLRRREAAPATAKRPAKAPFRQIIQRPAFWLLAGAFGLASMNHTMLVTYFIPLFTGFGIAKTTAVLAASVVGPFQVIGRLVLMMNGGRISPLLSTRLALVGLITSSAVLMAAGLAPILVFVFAAVQGASVGMMSILRPILIAEIMGLEQFGAVSGAIATVPIFATALAPLVGALVLGVGGGAGLLTASLTLALTALGLSALLRVSQVA